MAFETIGQKLRQARLDNNISLEELQQITKIQKKYLEAIENDMYDLLPGTFYVRAFIRQYAAAVGEDGDYLVAVFDGKIDPYAPARESIVEEIQESRTEVHEEGFISRFLSGLPAIILGLVAIAILIVVFYQMWVDKNSEPMIANSQPSVIQSTTSLSTETSTSESISSTNSSATSESTEQSSSSSEQEQAMISFDSESGNAAYMTVKNIESPVEVSFEGQNGPCWLGIMVDGAYVFEATLNEGDKQETNLPDNATNATIILGASSNVKVKVAGEELAFNPNNTDIVQRNIYLTLDYSR